MFSNVLTNRIKNETPLSFKNLAFGPLGRLDEVCREIRCHVRVRGEMHRPRHFLTSNEVSFFIARFVGLLGTGNGVELKWPFSASVHLSSDEGLAALQSLARYLSEQCAERIRQRLVEMR